MWRRSKRQSAFCLEVGRPPHLAARARCHPDALAPGPEGVSPLPSCELVEGTTIRSCFSACAGVSATGQGVPELPCGPNHLPSVHDMGSFFSRPVLIFPTNLNRATNGFITVFSRVLLGGKWQTQALSAVSRRDLSGKLTWGAHR